MKYLKRRPAIFVALIVVASAMVGGAFAAGQALKTRHVAAASNVLFACVKTKKNDDGEGQIRMVSTLAECKKNETGIQWNVVGPQGPQGIQGIQGIQGVPGISVSTAVLSSTDPRCPNGGIAVNSASGQTYVCNGTPGANGADGARGPEGPQGPQGLQGSDGPQGPPGTSGGTSTLASPNGVFKVEITDHGVYLRGPSGTVYVNRFKADVSPDPNFER